MTAIEIKNLHRSFPNKPHVINDLNLTVDEGENILLSGENGTGKTTLLKIMATLITPDRGEIYYYNTSISKNPRATRQLIGLVSSTEGGLFPRLNGRENISLIAQFLSLNKSKLSDKIDNWSTITPFIEALKTPFYLCSTGMKQLLLLFCTTMHEPKILFLDEPFKSLDPNAREQFIHIIEKKFKQQSIIIASHHLGEIEHIIDQQYVLKGGQLDH